MTRRPHHGWTATIGSKAQRGRIVSAWRPFEGGDVGKEDRGFASMDREKQREIASKGGKVAHEKGRAHQWSREEARAAGRKGGLAAHQRRQGTILSPLTE